MNNNYLFTSESVTEGHPDKVADAIADAVLDQVLKQDKYGRVACEVALGMGYVIVGGEITAQAHLDVNSLVRKVIKDIGYDKSEYGFDYRTVAVFNSIHEQSPDIAIKNDISIRLFSEDYFYNRKIILFKIFLNVPLVLNGLDAKHLAKALSHKGISLAGY